MKKIAFFAILLAVFASCKSNKPNYDASGAFEAEETIIPAEANGVIKSLNLEEGDSLKSGQLVGAIDSVQLFLKKKQLEAQIKAMGYKLPNIAVQTSQFKQQAAVTQTRLNYLTQEQARLKKLIAADAATPKQLDDITAQIQEAQEQLKVFSRQEAAQASALETQRSGLNGEVLPLYVQIEQINDQLAKSRIVNPINGTVLSKYAKANEMATIGKPLYKIADLSTLNLRAYITGDQFAAIKLNQKVTVFVDDANGQLKEYEGTVDWINTKAEFTPKTIQTKNERANLVYAVKIKVKNDGLLKIGMYGEVRL